jgi:hypothetical protein
MKYVEIMVAAPVKWKKGMRVLVKYYNEAYLGTVSKAGATTLTVKHDDDDVSNIPIKSKRLLGIGVNKKRKSAIPLSKANDYLLNPKKVAEPKKKEVKKVAEKPVKKVTKSVSKDKAEPKVAEKPVKRTKSAALPKGTISVDGTLDNYKKFLNSKQKEEGGNKEFEVSRNGDTKFLNFESEKKRIAKLEKHRKKFDDVIKKLQDAGVSGKVSYDKDGMIFQGYVDPEVIKALVPAAKGSKFKEVNTLDKKRNTLVLPMDVDWPTNSPGMQLSYYKKPEKDGKQFFSLTLAGPKPEYLGWRSTQFK